MDGRPDFFVAGPPEAGAAGLCAVLEGHPDLRLSGPAETGSLPTRVGVARTGVLGAITPYLLTDRDALRRSSRVSPHAKYVVMVRDPADRAYAHWQLQWSRGLEPLPDFIAAVDAERSRRASGCSPRWHYRGLGRYGRQMENLLRLVAHEQVLVLRYRELVERPDLTVDRVLCFLGVTSVVTHLVPLQPPDPFPTNTLRTRTIARCIRAADDLESRVPAPWSVVRSMLVNALQRGGGTAPALTQVQRRHVLEPLLADIDSLERQTGRTFDDWRTRAGWDAVSTVTAGRDRPSPPPPP